MNVYKIKNLKTDMQYVGVKLKDHPNYFGSGRLIIEAIKEFGKENFVKEILYTIPGEKRSADWEELKEIESQFILSFGTLYPDGYNKVVITGPVTLEQCTKGRKTQKRLGIGFYNPEVQAKAMASQKKNGTGCYNPVKGGLAAAKIMRENGTGMFDLEWHKKGLGPASQKKNGTGIYDPVARAKGNRKAHKIMREKKIGVYDPAWHEEKKRLGTGIYNLKARVEGNATQKRLGIGLYNLKVRAKGLVTRQKSARILDWIYGCPSPHRPYHTKLPFSEIAKRMREVLNGDVILS